MTREEIQLTEKQRRLRIEGTTLCKMSRETAKVIRELGMEATAKIIDDQAERVSRALDDLLPEGQA